jgi:hypothetical protein
MAQKPRRAQSHKAIAARDGRHGQPSKPLTSAPAGKFINSQRQDQFLASKFKGTADCKRFLNLKSR